MKRCTLVIPDAGPLNSLWVADRLDLLLALEMRIVIVDAVYDEVTSDVRYPKDRDVKAFIDANSPPFAIETTDTGTIEREKRASGAKLKRNAGEIAIADFMSSDDGLRKHLGSGDPYLLLFEDAGFRVLSKPPNLHLLSTVGLLRGLERVGVLVSADAVLREMTQPSKPGRRSSDARIFKDLPEGTDDPAAVGSRWTR